MEITRSFIHESKHVSPSHSLLLYSGGERGIRWEWTLGGELDWGRNRCNSKKPETRNNKPNPPMKYIINIGICFVSLSGFICAPLRRCTVVRFDWLHWFHNLSTYQYMYDYCELRLFCPKPRLPVTVSPDWKSICPAVYGWKERETHVCLSDNFILGVDVKNEKYIFWTSSIDRFIYLVRLKPTFISGEATFCPGETVMGERGLGRNNRNPQ